MIRWTRRVVFLLLISAASAATAQPIPSGTQHFGEPVLLPAPNGSTFAMAAGDINADGHSDVVTTAPGAIVTHVNDGTGHFTTVVSTTLMSRYGTQRLELVDINADGQLDLVVLDGLTWDGYVTTYTNSGDGSFEFRAGLWVRADFTVSSAVIARLGQPPLLWLPLNDNNDYGPPDYSNIVFVYPQPAVLIDLAQTVQVPNGTRYFDGYGLVDHMRGNLLFASPYCPDGLTGINNFSYGLYQYCPEYPEGGETRIVWPDIYSHPELVPLPHGQGYGKAIKGGGNATYLVYPTFDGGWQVVRYNGEVTLIRRMPSASGFGSEILGVADADGDGATDFFLVRNGHARYVSGSTEPDANAPETAGSFFTADQRPDTIATGRFGRTAGRDDIAVLSGGRVRVHFDTQDAAVQAQAPTVTVDTSDYGPTGYVTVPPAVVTAGASGGVAPYSYRFYVNGVQQSGDGSATISLSMPEGGAYTVMAIDANGVWATAQGMVVLRRPPGPPALTVSLDDAAATSDDLLSPVALTLTATVTNQLLDVSYQWLVDGLPINNAAAVLSTPFAVGAHAVQVIATDRWGGRTAQATAQVQVRIPGASGQGSVGPQGPAGAAGPMGPQGPTGPAGPAGADGAKGDRGDVGPAGPAGPTGPQGPRGETGETGATGATGPAGPAGATGSPGSVGPSGPAGPPGTPPAGSVISIMRPRNEGPPAAPAGYTPAGSYRQKVDVPNPRRPDRTISVQMVFYLFRKD